MINLNELELKTFTEQNVLDYCQLNNINFLDIKTLLLSSNKLTDISGIKLFKNLEHLYLTGNRLIDISVLNNLIKLKGLYLNNNKLKDIKNLYNLTKLKILDISGNKLTDISIVKNLSKLEILYIINSKLELNQIQYINSLKNLESLVCYKGFKDMKVLKQLNDNIRIIK